MKEELYDLAGHIARSKGALPPVWQDWASEIEMAVRKMANREAQPVGYFVRHRSAWDRPSKWRLWTECSAEDYAEFCKIIATGDADAGRFYEARILYDAPPAPVPAVNASPDFESWFVEKYKQPERLMKNEDGAYKFSGVQMAFSAWSDGRAAILAQPVSSGYKLPDGYKLMPLEMTDEIGEAIAMEARCCGGIALCIYEAALAAAPEGGNG